MNRVIEKVNKDGMSFKTALPQKEEKKEDFEYILLDDESKLSLVINSIPKDSIVAFDTETTGIDVKKAKIVGFSFAYEKSKAYYVPFKYDYEIIKENLDIELSLYADTMILSWLLDSSEKVGLDYQVDKYFHHKMISFKDIVKKGENFSNIDINKACEYAAEDALMTLRLFERQIEELKKEENKDLLDIAFKYEFDFIYVILEMERNGIKVDISKLEEIKQKNNIHIQELVSKIYEETGFEFNINSPKQLGVVLFENLKLPVGKKTKTGYSTNELVLQGLFDAHPVIPLLLNYREVYKLQSTYIEPLLKLALYRTLAKTCLSK